MKRTKRLTRRQQKQAKKIFDDLQASLPKVESKPRKTKQIFSLTHYLQKQAEKKHEKQHERADRRSAKKALERAAVKAAKELKRAKKEAKAAKEVQQ